MFDLLLTMVFTTLVFFGLCVISLVFTILIFAVELGATVGARGGSIGTLTIATHVGHLFMATFLLLAALYMLSYFVSCACSTLIIFSLISPLLYVTYHFVGAPVRRVVGT